MANREEIPLLSFSADGLSSRYATEQVMRRTRLVFIAALLVAAAATIIWFEWRERIEDNAFRVEVSRMRELGVLASEMIEQKYEGVVQVDGELRIDSFEAFAEYVKARRPSIVVTMDAKNPFPGFLPEGRYAHEENGEGEKLFWSERIFDRNVGYIQMRILRDGRTLELVNQENNRPD
ncbi:MAG: hypothetical protein ACFCVE_08650 [Phycisphaerae bacterium]